MSARPGPRMPWAGADAGKEWHDGRWCSHVMDSATLEQYRRNKDEYFGSNHHSPLDPADRDDFRGLRYFAPNPDLVFTTRLIAGDDAEVVIATSDGAERSYRRAGSVALEISGRDVVLTLYDAGHPGYFVPFRDTTSGNLTYAAGRYLDVQRSADDGTITIDFNLAYNPFCAYRDDFSCALPPVDNWLNVAIEAGEQTYLRSRAER